MGVLMEGKWMDTWYDTKSTQGKFVRSASQFRNWITPDGKAGPSGIGGFQAESDRYHLYVALACPWAHRTLIYRQLKGLRDLISVSVVHWYMAEHGWTFAPTDDGSVGDELNHADFLHQIYTSADPSYSGRVTVPVLWDKRNKTIVSNESSEIIRIFNSAFTGFSGVSNLDYYPERLRSKIDALNERVYTTVNNGVYKAGFATTQKAYEDAFVALFDTLDWLEQKLDKKRYLTGDTITEADWRLFTTLVRFDAVYVGHFKTNNKRIVDYPNLWGYTRDLYQQTGIADTVNFEHIKKHYYVSHTTINPTGIVPKGPDLDFLMPHGRG